MKTLVSIVLLSGLLACSREGAPPPPAPLPNLLPERELRGLVMRQSTVSGLAWVLHARTGVSMGTADPVQLEELKIEFYDGKESVHSVLTSKRGELDAHATTLLAEDSVVVTTPEGDRLETNTLRWDPVRERVTTQAFFRFHHGLDYLTGVGFDADPDLKSYVVDKDVTFVVKSQNPASLLEQEERR